jgi:hypothetical protein
MMIGLTDIFVISPGTIASANPSHIDSGLQANAGVDPGQECFTTRDICRQASRI